VIFIGQCSNRHKFLIKFKIQVLVGGNALKKNSIKRSIFPNIASVRILVWLQPLLNTKCSKFQFISLNIQFCFLYLTVCSIFSCYSEFNTFIQHSTYHPTFNYSRYLIFNFLVNIIENSLFSIQFFIQSSTFYSLFNNQLLLNIQLFVQFPTFSSTSDVES